MKQTWYHATTPDRWAEIQREGVLWGKRNAPSRCTYLASDPDHARHYGEILLEIAFDPDTHKPNNYSPNCWQCRVYSPIQLSNVKSI